LFGVLIVDDEEPVLDSYEFMLEHFSSPTLHAGAVSEEPAFALAGKARSGYEALKLIHELEPDLVFMDINIPGIDGISVIEDVYKKFPNMIFILSTAYERFDLAQRAIPLGVFAYLVKPISKKVFYSTLENVLSHLLAQKESAREETSETPLEAFFRRDIWTAMGEELWQRRREELNLPSDRGMSVLVELETEKEKICASLAEKFSYRHHCVYDLMLNRAMFLLSENIDENTEKARRHIAEIIAAVCAEFNVEKNAIFWGAGSLCRGPELFRSCSEALAEMEKRKNEAGSTAEERERLRIAELRKKLLDADEEARGIFAEIVGGLFSGEFTEKNIVISKIKTASLFALLADDVCGAEEAPPFDAANEIAALSDMSSWKQWTEINFEKLLIRAQQLKIERNANLPQPLAAALAYIREHYREDISLRDAADAAMVSVPHLSRLFGEKLKTNFVDYLTEIRMAAAEKFLAETNMTVKDIAFAVGYRDPNYFTKIFKKASGRLPTEARKK
jgi:two-component system response regulator YesN